MNGKERKRSEKDVKMARRLPLSTASTSCHFTRWPLPVKISQKAMWKVEVRSRSKNHSFSAQALL